MIFPQIRAPIGPSTAQEVRGISFFSAPLEDIMKQNVLYISQEGRRETKSSREIMEGYLEKEELAAG